MEQSLARTIWVIYLQAQGLSGLLLFLVCGTLYAHRRRSYFLYWTFAWFSFSLWRLFSGMVMGEHWLNAGSPSGHFLYPYIAGVCGWWHVSLWVLGLLHLRNVYQMPPATRTNISSEQSSPTRRTAARTLLAAAGFAVLAQAILPSAAQGVLSGVMALVYGISAAWFAARWWRTSQLGVLMLPVSLGMCAVARLYSISLAPDPDALLIPLAVLYQSALIDFLLQTFTVVAMIVVLLDDEDALLRETAQRLAESEDRFRLLFEHGGVGMALLSPDGDFVQVNPALIQMLGYSEADLLGRHVTEMMYPDDRSSSHRLREQAGSPQYEREKRFLHRVGRIVWARVVRVPIHGAGGVLRYHASVFIEVTERKQAEEALAASENRLRLRFQQAFDGISLWSPIGTFLDANPALCRLLGRSRDELLGQNVAGVAADPEAIRLHLRAVLEHSGDRCETRLYSEGGSFVDVEVNSAALEVEGQRLILGICRDISERKRAEAALRQAEMALRQERDFIAQILHTVEALILVVDSEGRILRFNNKCRTVSGFEEEEVRGRPFWECVLPERVVESAQTLFRQVLGAGDAAPMRVFEIPWRSDAGDERLIAWRYSLVRDESGQTRHVIGIGLDITDQRRLEEQLARARKMETLGTLVGGIAHDFNNQLTAILVNLEMVLDDLQSVGDSTEGELAAALMPLIRGAEQGAQRCSRNTARLLTFSRGRIGSIQSIALDRLLVETVPVLQHQLPPEIQVEVHTPPGLPLVAADPAQVQELLLNLTSNARDAMPDGGTLTLSLVPRAFTAADCAADLEARAGSFVELCVRDSGRGMTPEVRERIFEPFFTTKKVGQGIGLGLSVVYGIVKGHKGWIAVSSQLGAGAAFHIYLPVVAARVAPSPMPPMPKSMPNGDECILIVDDEPLVRDAAKNVLLRNGFRVLTADGGEEALELYRRRGDEIDVILLDYTMPRMNGVQVLQELLRLDPDVLAVFSSGYSTDREVDQLLAAGARAFVPKPYHPMDLVRTLREILAHRTAIAQAKA